MRSGVPSQTKDGNSVEFTSCKGALYHKTCKKGAMPTRALSPPYLLSWREVFGKQSISYKYKKITEAEIDWGNKMEINIRETLFLEGFKLKSLCYGI